MSVARCLALGGALVLAAVAPGAARADTVALWHMDEGSGTTMRDAAGNHTGTLDGVQPGVAGFAGAAYDFAGSGQATVPSAADLNPRGADITITIRLRTTARPASPDWDLIRKGLFTDPGEFKVEFQPSGQASCGFIGTSGSSELMAGPVLDDDAWHTVQCVKTSSSIELVVDGQTFSQAANVGSISNSADLMVGSRGGSEFFRGSLDEASVDIAGVTPQQPAPAPPPAPAPQPAPPATRPTAQPAAGSAPAAPAQTAAAPADGAPLDVATPSARAPTRLTVSSATLGPTRLVLRGRLGAGASARRLRVTLSRRTRHGTIRVTSRPAGGRSGRWRGRLVLPRAVRGLRRFTVTIRYLAEAGHPAATVTFTVRAS